MVSGSISLPSPGFFSPFPHGTCSLSVDGTYLALDGGPPRFLQNFTCSGVLGIPLRHFKVLYTGLSPSVVRLSRLFYYPLVSHVEVPQPRENVSSRFGLFPFRSPLLRESRLLSFPGGTEMFHFPSFASYGYVFTIIWLRFAQPGFPIRKSPDQSLFSSSPRLIAAYYVLHRLPSPRHPPSALRILTARRKNSRILMAR